MMSIHCQPTILVGAISLALGLTTSALTTTVLANESTPTTAKLNPLVVTATRSEATIDTIPARINILDQEILERSPMASLPELLKSEVAANVVQLGGYGQQSSIFLRGSNSTHTLVLQDNLRLNSATTGAASLPYLDTTDIAQVEILKGPASVLYGTDAIGGVVHLISKTPTENRVLSSTEVGEFNTYKAILGADFAQNGIYTQIRGQRLESDGMPVKEDAQQQRAAYDQKGYSAKFGTEQKDYALSFHYSENEGNAQYNNTTARLNNQDFDYQLLHLKGRVNLSDQVELNARVAQFKDNLYQNDPNFMGGYDYVESTTKEAELYTKWQLNASHNLLLGVKAQDVDGNVLSYGAAYQPALRSNGYFIQHQYDQAALNTQVGLRVEDHDQYGTHTIGQAAVRYQVFPTTSIYANVGSAFRSPSLNELYGSSGNLDLKPEESLSFEIGADQKLNYGLETGISLYHTTVDHLIDAVEASQYTFTNLEKATFAGVESYIGWTGEHAYAKASYNYVRAKDDSTGNDLSRRPRHKATLTAGWKEALWGASTQLTANSDADNSAYDDVMIPGHLHVDLHAYYQAHPNVKLFTNLNNLLDTRYRTAFGSGYYINAGRMASVGVNFQY